jgi:hypothetical protein
MFTGWVTTIFTLQLNVYTVAISSVNKIVINEWLRLNNSGFLMRTRTSILLLSLSKKSSLKPAKSPSICWGHSSQIFVNSLLGRPFEQASRPPSS